MLRFLTAAEGLNLLDRYGFAPLGAVAELRDHFANGGRAVLDSPAPPDVRLRAVGKLEDYGRI